jgi:hypothetical protein
MILSDFGVPVGRLDSEAAARAKITDIENEFDLVMIMERFDESLVLLRRQLCWNFEDMVSGSRGNMGISSFNVEQTVCN